MEREEDQTMKITTFNPQIITKDAEPVRKLFEELGFEQKHNPKGIGEQTVDTKTAESAIMISPSGFAINLFFCAQQPVLTNASINVRLTNIKDICIFDAF